MLENSLNEITKNFLKIHRDLRSLGLFQIQTIKELSNHALLTVHSLVPSNLGIKRLALFATIGYWKIPMLAFHSFYSQLICTLWVLILLNWIMCMKEFWSRILSRLLHKFEYNRQFKLLSKFGKHWKAKRSSPWIT